MATYVTRRTVLTSAAWATPVVALAVATPLAAASTTALEVFFTPALLEVPADQEIASFTVGVRNNGTTATGAVTVVVTFDYQEIGISGPYPGTPAFADTNFVYTDYDNGILTISSGSLAAGQSAGANLRVDDYDGLPVSATINASATAASADFTGGSASMSYVKFEVN